MVSKKRLKIPDFYTENFRKLSAEVSETLGSEFIYRIQVASSRFSSKSNKAWIRLSFSA